ncbi:MAG: hypothetical protein AUJ49_06695 [Desulfovibrionaceae bacterium CG1_02_65_16]|nr:MAG: hypothetical protein AUJ49_06695 [Desulfovibrionaceae bacterium CG1_02_65_16]
MNFVAAAFDHLHHDLLFVTPDERAALAKAGVRPRSSWKGSDRLEQHILHAEGGPRIGVILLPPVPYSAPRVPESRINQMEMAVHRLRASCKLVVVMSPWGYSKEQELLTRADKNNLPDILLGSGPGIGQTGVLAAGGKTAWVRSFAEGKSVLRIDILVWPEHNSTFKWTEEKNIRMSLFGLTDQYQEEPQMLTLMQTMGTD